MPERIVIATTVVLAYGAVPAVWVLLLWCWFGGAVR